MAVAQNNTITYGELIEDFKNLLFTRQKPINIVSSQSQYENAVPKELRKDYVNNDSKYKIVNEDGKEIKATISVKNETVMGYNFSGDHNGKYYVTESEVMTQLTNFLNERGIDTKSNELVTTRGILNFWNLTALFCACKLKHVVSNYVSSPKLMYDKSATISSITNIPDGELITATDITTMFNSWTNIVNKLSKTHVTLYDIVLTSSSSSSCSSCCSSSSSSSMFIAYMKI